MVVEKKFILIAGFFLILIISLVLISAPGNPVLGSTLASNGNYSTTINFSCASSMENARNASLFYNASGGATVFANNITLITNTSENQSVFENAALSITGLSDLRTYNLTCMMANTSGSVVYSTSTYNVTFDSTAPNVSTFFTTSNNGNYSDTIVLNVSVSDAIMGLAYVYFNISSVNGSVQYNFTKATNSTIYYNLTINTSLYTDGVYNVTVYANDTQLNNLNNSKWIKIRMDNINPTAAFSCTPSSVDVGATVTCSCDPTDSGSGINATATSYTINPSTTTAGTFTQSCTFNDMVGKSGNASTSITLNSPSSGTGTGGGTSWSKTVVVNEEKFAEGYTKDIGENERIKVNIEGDTHSISVSEVSGSTAKITISSETITATLSVGDERKFDISADGYYDLYVKLNSISSNKADITVKSINEKVTEESESQEQAKEESVTGETQEPVIPPAEEEKETSLLLWILIIAVIVIIIAIAVGIGMKKRK